MKLFEYLNEDRAHILERLQDTAANYSTWTRDRVFEAAKKSLESLKLHFQKEDLLVNNLKDDDGMKDIMSKASAERKAITAEVENIVMIHVDEPESSFEDLLTAIAAKLSTYDSFCRQTYYPALVKHFTEDDLGHAREQMDQLVLS